MRQPVERDALMVLLRVRPQLQAYVDEFVFRHNRRGNPQAAFQTPLGLGTNREPAPLSIVRGATDMPYFPIRE